MELMSRETTSEERLLKLIRKKDHAAAAARAGAAKGDLSSEARRAEGTPKPRVDMGAVLPRVLAAVAVGLAVYGVVQYWTLEPAQIVSAVAPVTERDAEDVADPAPPTPAQPLAPQAYPQDLAARDIFQAPWERPAAGAAPAGASAMELAKNLKVVGILLDADPKAIIEDMAMHQTFFVSPGERVGGALLEEIREDRVILNFNEERVELVP